MRSGNSRMLSAQQFAARERKKPRPVSNTFCILKKMKIFGFFEKLNRVTEIVVGIFLIIPFIIFCYDIFLNGFSEDSIFYLLACIPFLIFGIVILFLRKIKRDLIIYFLIFFMAGIASLILGILTVGSHKSYALFLIILSIFCIIFSYRYITKIRSVNKNA